MVREQIWIPSKNDQHQAEEHYVRYLVGVALIVSPEKTLEIHGYGFPEADAIDPLLCHAERLMYEGLQNVIRYNHRPENRSQIGKLEGRHAEALPRMHRMVSTVCSEQAERIDKLNPFFSAVRPAPIFNETVYDYICHSRLTTLTTQRLIDPLLPDPNLAHIVAGRTLQSVTGQHLHIA